MRYTLGIITGLTLAITTYTVTRTRLYGRIVRC